MNQPPEPKRQCVDPNWSPTPTNSTEPIERALIRFITSRLIEAGCVKDAAPTLPAHKNLLLLSAQLTQPRLKKSALIAVVWKEACQLVGQPSARALKPVNNHNDRQAWIKRLRDGFGVRPDKLYREASNAVSEVIERVKLANKADYEAS